MSSSKVRTLLVYQMFVRYSDEENPISATDIMRMLADKGVSAERKAIYKDIQALNEIGCDIIRIQSPKKGFFMANRTFELPEVRLMIDAVSSAGFITPKKTQSLVRKLETLVSVGQALSMTSQVYVDSVSKCDNEEIYITIDRLHEAIQNRKKVRFNYKRRCIDVRNRERQTNKTFTVSPYALIWKQDHYYLVCNNAKYNNLMNLRIDRIQRLKILDEKARSFREVSKYKVKFDARDYADKMFNMFAGEQVNVTLRFNISLEEEILDRFGTKIDIKPVDDSLFETTVSASQSDGFVSWIMQFGDKIKIIEPYSLAQKVKEKSQSIVELYE